MRHVPLTLIAIYLVLMSLAIGYNQVQAQATATSTYTPIWTRTPRTPAEVITLTSGSAVTIEHSWTYDGITTNVLLLIGIAIVALFAMGSMADSWLRKDLDVVRHLVEVRDLLANIFRRQP